MSRTTSATLISELKAGEREAWRKYVETYTPLIAYWLRKYGVEDPHESLDFIQETNASVWQHIVRFRYTQQGGSFRGWLRTITLNRLRSHYRSQKDRPLHLPIVSNAVVDANSVTTDEPESVGILVRQVVMTMKHPRMSAPQRQAVLEHLLNGVSVLQAAKEFGLHEGTLRAKVNGCLVRLRSVLQDELW
ncbi:MAG: RNA polymerase sigma factor [Pirellulaceae bacterium]